MTSPGQRLNSWVGTIYTSYGLSAPSGSEDVFPDFDDDDKPIRFEYCVHELSHGVTLEPVFDVWPFSQEFDLSRWVERKISRMRMSERKRAEARAIAVEMEVLDRLDVPYNRLSLVHYAAMGATVSAKSMGAMIGAHVRTRKHCKQAQRVVDILRRECG